MFDYCYVFAGLAFFLCAGLTLYTVAYDSIDDGICFVDYVCVSGKRTLDVY